MPQTQARTATPLPPVELPGIKQQDNDLTDRQIRDGRYPDVDDVCRKFGVSRRIAFTDRSHLRDRLDAPIKFDHAHAGWTYTDPT